MIVYNCPGRTGVDMKPDTVAILSKHKNIIGNQKYMIYSLTSLLTSLLFSLLTSSLTYSLSYSGIKDATGDLNRIQEFKSKCNPNFLIYSGEDDSGCEFVNLGGDGVISVTANVAPKLMSQMLSLSKEGYSQLHIQSLIYLLTYSLAYLLTYVHTKSLCHCYSQTHALYLLILLSSFLVYYLNSFLTYLLTHKDELMQQKKLKQKQSTTS